MTTVSELQQRLQARTGEWPSIAKAAGLSYWWVMKIGQGKIPEPGITKVTRLIAELDARDGDSPQEARAH